MNGLNLRRTLDEALPPSHGMIKVKDVSKSKESWIAQIMES
jgi:hypothetical protein